MTDSQPMLRNLMLDDYRAGIASGDHVLLDVREDEEWAMGHVPGALHIPLYDLPERLSEVPQGKPVVVMCASGVRSLYGGQFLVESGFSDVYSLDGGINLWVRKGHPVER